MPGRTLNQPASHQSDSATGGTAVYLHVPFCETKCGYCDFYSVAVKDRDTTALVAATVDEIGRRILRAPRPLRTIFFGGGTPTVLPHAQLRVLLKAVRPVLEEGAVIEFTVEANPATVDDSMASLLAESGVTRVSMGAQSFLADELATLERLHTPDDIAPSVRVLRRNGISQVNLDLIFGIPGQSLKTWAYSLGQAVALEPDHIACYGLTYEPATRLTALRDHGRLTPCDEELEIELYLHTIDVLTRAGYEQYETSNFARPGCRCAHNLLYWKNRPYVGIGPSAVGCYADRRYKNVPDVAAYVRLMQLQGHAECETEAVDRELLILELPLMQLRLIEGLSIQDFQARIGDDPDSVYGEALRRLVDRGLLTVSNTHIALTQSGRLVTDTVLRELAGSAGAPCALPVLPAVPSKQC